MAMETQGSFETLAFVDKDIEKGWYGGSDAAFTSDDLIGIDLNKIENLATDINTYIIEPVNTELDNLSVGAGYSGGSDNPSSSTAGYGGNGNGGFFDEGLKGAAADAAVGYVNQIKGLLVAYVSRYQGLVNLCTRAAEAFVKNDASNATIVESASEEINTKAAAITFDDVASNPSGMGADPRYH